MLPFAFDFLGFVGAGAVNWRSKKRKKRPSKRAHRTFSGSQTVTAITVALFDSIYIRHFEPSVATGPAVNLPLQTMAVRIGC